MRKIFLLCISLLFLTGCHSGYYNGPLSDHFNGVKFYNQIPHKNYNLCYALNMWISHEKSPWPIQPPNRTHPPVMKVSTPYTVKITFINHATVLIQSQQYTILTDPIWSLRASPFSWIGPKRVKEPGLNFKELPHIDAVLISHSHYDHMDIPTLQRLANVFNPVFLVPLGDKNFLLKYGISNVVEMDWWQTYAIPNGSITFLPAEHWSSRWLDDHNQTLWGSFGIKLAGDRLYFAGDTGYAHHFKRIQQQWGNSDLAFLPIGGYDPPWLMKQYHTDPAEAIKAMHDLHARLAIAIHFGTFQLSGETYNDPLLRLDAARRAAHISDQEFMVLTEGFSVVLDAKHSHN